MKLMTFKFIGNLHIIVVGERDPTREDWNLYMQAIMAEERKGTDVTQMRTLVFSDGGGPNAVQRKLTSDVLKGRATPISVLTGNMVMRGVITALRWFNPLCRAFAPDAMGDALKFLDVPPERYETIMVVARELQRDLGLIAVKSIHDAKLSPAYAASSPRL